MIINETTVKWLEEQQSRLKTRKWFSEIDMPEFGKKFKSPVSVMGQIIFWTTLQESKIPEKLFEKVKKMLKSSPQRNFDFHRLMSWIQNSNYRSIILKIISACLPIFLGHCQTFWCIVLKVFGLTILKNWKIFKVNFYFRIHISKYF